MEAQMHDLFTPPIGFIRNIPLEKQDEYRSKYSSLGPFEKHEYDMDVCTLYRQMEDLNGRYAHIGGLLYEKYVAQIKNYAEMALSEATLDAEFYLNNFYYVIKADSAYYFSLLGLFFALSDPLKVVPILEHHLGEFVKFNKKEEEGAEYFLGKLEYTVCNFLRTNRFPEDYFAKHDKIINWVYRKKEIELYRSEMTSKLDLLITSINRLSPKQKISNEMVKQKPGRKKNTNNEVFVVEKMVEVLIQDLRGYFNENSIDGLRKILTGKAAIDLIVLFDGQANQLIDVFRIYADAKFIEADARAVATWICKHFMYQNNTSGYVPISNQTCERIIYKKTPLGKSKRIPLTGLPKTRDNYYSNRKKTPFRN